MIALFVKGQIVAILTAAFGPDGKITPPAVIIKINQSKFGMHSVESITPSLGHNGPVTKRLTNLLNKTWKQALKT